MNKENYTLILESALLAYDGVTEEQIVENYKIDAKLAKVGFQIYKKLNPEIK